MSSTAMTKVNKQDLSIVEDQNITDNQAPVATDPENSDNNVIAKGDTPKVVNNNRKGPKLKVDYEIIPEVLKPLSDVDQKILAALEGKVEGSFLTACSALLEIQNYSGGRLWRSSEKKEFKDYVANRFGYTARYCKLMVRAASFNLEIAELGDGTPPLARESHIRPIIQQIPEDQQMQFLVDFYKDHNITKETVNSLKADNIKKAVDSYLKENPVETPEDKVKNEKKAADKVKKARDKGKKLLTQFKNAVKDLSNFTEIESKLGDILNLLKENN